MQVTEYEYKNNETIEFGMYPQSRVVDKTKISSLLRSVKFLPTQDNYYNWKPFDYVKDDKMSHFMWYVDIVRGQDKFRGIYIKEQRPDNIKSSYIGSCPQKDNGYYSDFNTYRQSKDYVYWFKWEPLKWVVISKNDGYMQLVCSKIIDAQPFLQSFISEMRYISTHGAPANTYENNYEYSSINEWLNSEFLNNAFSLNEKEMICAQQINNFIEDNKYACSDFFAKVALLSVEEAMFSSVESSDYAKAQGYDEKYKGVLLRSPNAKQQDAVCGLGTALGGVIHTVNVSVTGFGIVPLISISYDKKKSFVREDYLAHKANESGAQNNNGEYLLFGYYPQGEIDNYKLLNYLNEIAHSTNDLIDKSTWCKFDGYNGGWYKDVVFEAQKYRGVFFERYKPLFCEDTYCSTRDEIYHSMSLGHKLNKVYWFKWNPIQWRILKETNNSMTLICNSILDAHSTKAELHSWLEKYFVLPAFENNKLNLNGDIYSASIEYFSIPTINDVLSSEYGYSILYDKADERRELKASTYAWLQGARNNWALENFDVKSDENWEVNDSGIIQNKLIKSSNFNGIVPILKISY